MNNVNNSLFNRFYEGLVNSPMIEALTSSPLYRTATERLTSISAQIPLDALAQYFHDLKIDSEWTRDSFCSFRQTLQKVGSEVPKFFSESTLSDLEQKQRLEFLEKATLTPLVEQALFQGLIQDVLLTRVPRAMLPRYERKSVDEPLNKFFRMIITAGAYTGYQLLDASGRGEMYDPEQLISTFAGGLLYSFIKETDLGIVGSTMTQIAINALSHYPKMELCSSTG